jgi:DivIVA protein
MTNFRKPGVGLEEHDHPGIELDELRRYDDEETDAAAPVIRPSLGELAGRVTRWFQGLEPEPGEDATAEHDTLGELGVDEDEPAGDGAPPRFELVRYGYNQSDVDRALSELERELAVREQEVKDLRAQVKPPPSITEEIERLGEQTASILVVAHDQAHQTTRRAQEQAERCIADAAANAVAITAEAKERLRELDDETDSVWRERERLLEDTRTVSEQLATLVDEALSRFPADAGKPTARAT